MKVQFRNKTAQTQQINTIREGFNVEPEGVMSVEFDDLYSHEVERLKKFFDFVEPAQEKQPKAAPAPKTRISEELK